MKPATKPYANRVSLGSMLNGEFGWMGVFAPRGAVVRTMWNSLLVGIEFCPGIAANVIGVTAKVWPRALLFW